jgi:hypothetical protein
MDYFIATTLERWMSNIPRPQKGVIGLCVTPTVQVGKRRLDLVWARETFPKKRNKATYFALFITY